jgi:hypothetical protein
MSDTTTHTADELRKEAEAQERHARDMAKVGMGGDCPKRTASMLRAGADAMKLAEDRMGVLAAYKVQRDYDIQRIAELIERSNKAETRVKVLEEALRPYVKSWDQFNSSNKNHADAYQAFVKGHWDDETKARAALEKKPAGLGWKLSPEAKKDIEEIERLTHWGPRP